MERGTGTEVYGCGSTQSTDITLNIQTTTGGNFSVSLNGKHTVEHLKKVVSKKLKVCKDRICLLHRERQLRDGTLEENGLLDGARVILLPSVETGLLSQRTENSVMQALESLNENQVNDFLTGKSPLNLTMRLGDHMMLIQLQLSTLNSSGSRSLRTSTPTKSSSTIARSIRREIRDSTSNNGSSSVSSSSVSGTSLTSESTKADETLSEADKEKLVQRKTLQKKRNIELLKNALKLYKEMSDNSLLKKFFDENSLEKIPDDNENDENEKSLDTTQDTLTDQSGDTLLKTEQSPIKSLSNLVSSPIDAAAKKTIANSVRSSLIDLLSKSKSNDEPKPCSSKTVEAAEPDEAISDDESFTEQSSFLAESTIDEYPMENLFNSAVDKGLFEEQDESMMDREISNLATMSHGAEAPAPAAALPSFQSLNEPLKTKRFQYLLHKTSKFKHPIVQNKQKTFMQSVVNKHKKRMQIRQDSDLAQPSASSALAEHSYSRKLILQPSRGQTDDLATPSTSRQVLREPEAPKKEMTPEGDNKNLIEASKNLTQKLKKLSKEVLTNKIDFKRAEDCMRSKIGPGAVIESMKHHGKGIYSGTFSGTLNPALQDRYGRPKRDISTIIHILNDLLCATPPIALAPKEPGCNLLKKPAPAGHCPACYGKLASDLCHKCDSSTTLASDNSKTKCKLEQLRLVMQQKKQRREARKLQAAPYVSPPRPEGDGGVDAAA